jgi:hypothetical protein
VDEAPLGALTASTTTGTAASALNATAHPKVWANASARGVVTRSRTAAGSNDDRRRGYGHALAFRQLEISDTRTFDRPLAGRAWFEQTIPDQLTLGRPDRGRAVRTTIIRRLGMGKAGLEPATSSV